MSIKKRDNILTDTLKDVLKNMVFSVIVMRKLKGYKPKISDAWFREDCIYRAESRNLEKDFVFQEFINQFHALVRKNKIM